jgi:hypothetical protein
MRLADTASSRAKQMQSYQAARARQRAALQRSATDRAAADDAALAAHPDIAARVLATIRQFVEEAQDLRSTEGFDELVGTLSATTGLPERTLWNALTEIQNALDAVRVQMAFAGWLAGCVSQ